MAVAVVFFPVSSSLSVLSALLVSLEGVDTVFIVFNGGSSSELDSPLVLGVRVLSESWGDVVFMGWSVGLGGGGWVRGGIVGCLNWWVVVVGCVPMLGSSLPMLLVGGVDCGLDSVVTSISSLLVANVASGGLSFVSMGGALGWWTVDSS